MKTIEVQPGHWVAMSGETVESSQAFGYGVTAEEAERHLAQVIHLVDSGQVGEE